MAPSSAISCSKKRKQYSSLELRPRMLKDFLLDDSNSCSSNGFKSFPRKAYSSVRNLIEIELNSGRHAIANPQKLQRSRSKAAASATISAFQAMIHAVVKNIHFASVNSPSIMLPRSLSRKLSKRISQLNAAESHDDEVKITVIRVKDIIRWKSFHDMVKEKSRPSDFVSSPDHHCTTTTTTTTTGSTSTPCSSNGSSWCDSDFTSEEYGENFLPYVSKDPMEMIAGKTAVGPKKYASEEQHRHSPVSVLEFEYEEEETNEVEEMARRLLNRVRETSSMRNYDYQSICTIEKLLLDLFREEIGGAKWNIIDETRNEELEHHMVEVAKAWIDGEEREIRTKWGVMERKGRWSSNYEEDLAYQVEKAVMNILVDELLADLL